MESLRKIKLSQKVIPPFFMIGTCRCHALTACLSHRDTAAWTKKLTVAVIRTKPWSQIIYCIPNNYHQMCVHRQLSLDFLLHSKAEINLCLVSHPGLHLPFTLAFFILNQHICDKRDMNEVPPWLKKFSGIYLGHNFQTSKAVMCVVINGLIRFK